MYINFDGVFTYYVCWLITSTDRTKTSPESKLRDEKPKEKEKERK